MTAAASLASAALLVWLGRTRFSRAAVAASVVLAPLLILLSASRLELGLTILVEAPIVWAFCGALRLERWPALMTCIMVNILTQPLLYLALRRLAATDAIQWRPSFAAGELAVWIVEAMVYFACLPSLRRSSGGLVKALAISAAANGASAVVGLLAPI